MEYSQLLTRVDRILLTQPPSVPIRYTIPIGFKSEITPPGIRPHSMDYLHCKHCNWSWNLKSFQLAWQTLLPFDYWLNKFTSCYSWLWKMCCCLCCFKWNNNFYNLTNGFYWQMIFSSHFNHKVNTKVPHKRSNMKMNLLTYFGVSVTYSHIAVCGLHWLHQGGQSETYCLLRETLLSNRNMSSYSIEPSPRRPTHS